MCFMALVCPTPSIKPRQHSPPGLWLIACFFFGVGDVVTTGVGVGIVGVAESNPFITTLLQQYGFSALGALKLGTLGGCYFVWRHLSRPHCVGIPLGLAVVGVSVTAWNLHIVIAALIR